MISRWCCITLFVLSVAKAEFDKRDFSNNGRKKPILDIQDLNLAVKVADEIISKWARLETNLADSEIVVREMSPSHGQLIDSYPTQEALDYGKHALIANRASLYLVQRHCQRSNIYLADCLEAISQESLAETPLGEKCASQFVMGNCTTSQTYRTYDGSCNHATHPNWGKSLTAYSRLIPALYGNGINEPRRSVSKRPLPSPRRISNILIPDINKTERTITLAFVQWTQFISNDLFHTPISKMVHTRKPIECCNYNGRNLSPRFLHPICQPISISVDDPDYSSERTLCMNYVRSLTSLPDNCNFGSAEQMNQATHYLDGSMIYGSTNTKAASLRLMRNGKLKTINKNNDELLSISDTPENSCQTDRDDICFKSGDPRVNMHPHHAAFYTIWVREHNRIAEILSQINPHWNDGTVFEETRRIVIAEIQHITYKYWVPFVLGREDVRGSGSEIKARGYSNVFNENVNPAVSNSFATVGLRFINSMYQSHLRLYDEKGFQNGSLPFKDYFNKPSILQEPGMLDRLLTGLSLEASQEMDASFVKDVTNFLFRGSSPMGQDIASLDIQRGRDHGLPGYNKFRMFCNMSSSDKFETFADNIPASNVKKLRSLYSHPDDVDLIVGAILEVPKPGSPVGPTFQCLIREQMIRTKTGDKFFYDIGGQPHSFKEPQLNEIKKISLARIFCDNIKNIKGMQLDVFKIPSPKNPLVSCDDYSKIPRINLSLWKGRLDF